MLLASGQLLHKHPNSQTPVQWSSYGSRGSPSSGGRSSSSPHFRPGCVWTQWWRTARRSYRGRCKPLQHPRSRGDKHQLLHAAIHTPREWRMKGWMKAEERSERKEKYVQVQSGGEEEQAKDTMQSRGCGDVMKGRKMWQNDRKGKGGRRRKERGRTEKQWRWWNERKNTGTGWKWHSRHMQINGARRWKVERKKNMQGGAGRDIYPVCMII